MTLNITTYEDMRTMIVEDNMPALLISRELGTTVAEVWDTIHKLGLDQVYREMSTQRLLKMGEESKKTPTHKTVSSDNCSSEFIALSQGKVLPGRKPFRNYNLDSNTLSREFTETDWEAVEEIKAMICRGVNVEQRLRHAGVPEWKITMLMIKVDDLSIPERRECIRHGFAGPKIDTWHLKEGE